MRPSPATALLYLLSMVAVARSGDEPDAGSYRTRTDGPHGSDPRGQLFSPSPLPGQCRRRTRRSGFGTREPGSRRPSPQTPSRRCSRPIEPGRLPPSTPLPARPAQRAAGLRTRVLAAVDYERPVDEHGFDARRVTVRAVVRSRGRRCGPGRRPRRRRNSPPSTGRGGRASDSRRAGR